MAELSVTQVAAMKDEHFCKSDKQDLKPVSRNWGIISQQLSLRNVLYKTQVIVAVVVAVDFPLPGP